ncbi:hypothetical protein [Virgibacillus sp. CBA3643]|uniref:hypothetical protein n=1 Tax=Virgibacillus sp. CBA3643 TaxID=2942278 RepID=UPI0035A2F962
MNFKYEIEILHAGISFDEEVSYKGEIEADDAEDAHYVLEDLTSLKFNIEPNEMRISILANDGEGFYDTVLQNGMEV